MLYALCMYLYSRRDCDFFNETIINIQKVKISGTFLDTKSIKHKA